MSTTKSLNLPKQQAALISFAGGHGLSAVKTIPLFLDGKSEDGKLPDNEVLIKVRAVGLNPTDEKHASGMWGEQGKVVGCDAAGDVICVGSAVKHVKAGDRVAGFTYGCTDEMNGAFAEYCRIPESTVLKLPDSMSYQQAAAMPIPHWTAVQALFMRLALPPPSKAGASGPILIWGGATSVAHHLIQLSKLSGLSPITTASTDHNEHLTSLGAAAVFDYKDDKAVDKIKQAAKADIKYAVDCSVVNDSTLKCVEAVASGGHVITLLPVPENAKKAAKDKGVKIEFMLSYLLLGKKIVFGKGDDKIHFDANPREYEAALTWATNEWPGLVADWKDTASSKFCAPRIKHMPGSLDKIEDGFKYMREGNVHAEKLVYTIA